MEKIKSIYKTGKAEYPFVLLSICIFAVYLPSLQGEFTNWDDRIYVLENPYITHISFQMMLKQFSVFFMGNYHPLTLLSLSIDYLFFGDNPFGYHLNNILLHIVNTLLVAVFIRKLVANSLMAFMAALLFGVHPMHVESVAWISERKDVLYAMFFLLSLITFFDFIRSGKILWYLLSVLFFILSCLSKGQAVVLPFVLLLTIHFLGKSQLIKKYFFHLIPFLIISVGFGILAILAQNSAAALDMVQYPLYLRIVFAAAGLTQYIVKLVAPFSLSAFYPYPVAPSDSLPVYLLLYLIPAAIIFIIWIKSISSAPVVFFGIGFFLINIFMVLQWLPVGRAIMADRYVYLPMIGYCLLIASLINHRRLLRFRTITRIIIVIYCVVLAGLSWQRNHIWRNSEVLWSDVISKFPGAPLPYFNRGNYYMQLGINEKAVKDYTTCIELDNMHWEAYTNRGVIFTKQSEYLKAINDFDSALMIDPGQLNPRINRANAYKGLGDFRNAIEDYHYVLKLQPGNLDARLQRANLLIAVGDSGQAGQEIKQIKQSVPNTNESTLLEANMFFHQGQKWERQGELRKAAELYKKTTELRPDFAEGWMFLGVVYGKLNKTNDAISALSQALKIKADYAQALASRGVAFASLGNFTKAIEDIDKAILLEKSNGVFHFNKALIYLNNRKHKDACIELKVALDLGYQEALPVYQKECGQR